MSMEAEIEELVCLRENVNERESYWNNEIHYFIPQGRREKLVHVCGQSSRLQPSPLPVSPPPYPYPHPSVIRLVLAEMMNDAALKTDNSETIKEKKRLI